MRTSIYVLAFLLPLTGALAVCPEPNTLTPEVLKQIQDRLKNDKKDLPLLIGDKNYLVIRGTGAAKNYDMLSTSPLKTLHSPASGMCVYSASDSEKDMNFILQPEKNKDGGSDGT